MIAAILLSASAPAYAASYVGHFNVLVTSGGRFDTTYDEIGDPVRNYTSLVGRTMALRWSSETTFNVRSPAWPFEIRPVFTVNSADVGGVRILDLYSAPFDGGSFRSATFDGNADSALLTSYINRNGGLDQTIRFSYSNGSRSAIGSGEAIAEDYYNEFGISFKFDIVGGRAFAAVPEPMTWALMLAGFGACGTALRRRRAATAIF